MTNNGTPPDFGLQPLPEDYRIANRPSRIAQGHTVAEWFEEGAKMATTKPTHREKIEAAIKQLPEQLNEGQYQQWVSLKETLRVYDRCLEDMADVFEALRQMHCTCQNPEPYDWPHDESNTDCNLSIARDALARHA